MGRPLAKKYFGNRNTGSPTATNDSGIGGEGIASITIVQGTGKTAGAQTVTIGAPDEPTGVQAVATASVNGSGVVTITITEQGSGYSVAPTVTVAGGGTGYTFTAVLTTTNALNSGTLTYPSLFGYAYVPGDSQYREYDVIAQKGSRRYKVQTGTTGQYVGVCALTAAANGSLTSGQMNLIATDANGNTYYVTKLTAHLASLTQIAGGSNYKYTTGQQAPWSYAAASGKYVQVASAA